jgi:enamine deaminase RidA (YjgF/YER057c/UK114 family)
MTSLSVERIQPAGLKQLPLYTHVVKAGNTVYIAGQAAFDEEGRLIGPDDVVAQATQTFENLGCALKSVGATFANLVKITVFATDAAVLREIAAVRARYLGTPDPVASTFVAVTALAIPGLLVEIEAVAVLD